MSTPRDYYEVLGLKRDATADEIRKAYRKLARKFHPDVNKADDAAKRFAEISDAYEVLSNEEKRKQYDRFGHAGVGAGARGGPGAGGGWPGGQAGGQWQNVNVDQEDFSSIFEEIFGGRGSGTAGGSGAPFGGGFRPGARPRTAQPSRGDDITQQLSVSFMTAVRGGTEQLRISVNGQPAQAIDVKIPAGTRDGAKLRLKGKGRPGPRGGENGDLLLAIKVGAHPFFRRDGLDLFLDVPISLAEAVRGTTVNVPLLSGTADLRVPPGASSGRKLRIKGQGIKAPDGTTGDLFAVVQIVAPDGLSERGNELIDELADELPNPRSEVPWKS